MHITKLLHVYFVDGSCLCCIAVGSSRIKNLLYFKMDHDYCDCNLSKKSQHFCLVEASIVWKCLLSQEVSLVLDRVLTEH